MRFVPIFFFLLAGKYPTKIILFIYFMLLTPLIALTKPTFVFALPLYVVINKCRLNHLLCMLMCEKLVSHCLDVNLIYIDCVLASC